MEIIKGKLGGARPGAGRKKGWRSKRSIIASEERAKIQQELAKHEQELITLKLKIAKGELYAATKTDQEGKPLDVYRTLPNNQAIDWCLEYIAGKTPEKSENKTDIPQLDVIAQTLINVANSKTR